MEEDLLAINEQKFVQLAKKLSSELERNISPINICYALFMVWGDRHEIEWIPEVYDLNIDFEKAIEVLRKFDFGTFSNEIISDQAAIEDIVLYQKKVLIKSAGIVWYIHQNDADHFPSNPHAHQVGENIKLDLSNGNCYRKREFLSTIPKKELLKIREQAEIKFKGKVQLPILNIP